MSTTENSINNSVQTKKANTNINNRTGGTGWDACEATYLSDGETISEIFLVLDHGLPGARAELALGLGVDAHVALAAPACWAAVAGK